ncbi:MAG: two-component system response regulator [Desulfobacteraceae bacterium 4572_19]|nr:MAG: two-component system response regulator [Desulfobacteraceae bacterium 4572_19]
MSEKVLIIDDEKDFLEALSQRMIARDMEVSTATTAKEAIKKAKAKTFDAIIVDLQMPEMDGLETLKELKKINPDLQIILLTGHATVEKSIKAMKLGAMDLLEKPADIKVLIEKIHKAKAKKMILVEKHTEEKIEQIVGSKGW